jgi:hypothetical protein
MQSRILVFFVFFIIGVTMIRKSKPSRKAVKGNPKFRRKAYHIQQVRAWGYTRREAYAFCIKNNWFGDKIAIG